MACGHPAALRLCAHSLTLPTNSGSQTDIEAAHALLLVALLSTRSALLATLGTPEATALSDSLFSNLEVVVDVQPDTMSPDHEAAATMLTMLAQSTRLRHRAAAGGEVVAGTADRHKRAALHLFKLCTRDPSGRNPVLIVALRILGDVLVATGCVSHAAA